VSSAERPITPTADRGAPQPGAPLLRYFRLFTQALNIAGTILILGMAIAVNADVVGRDLFNHPIPGVNEFIGLSIVAVVFLQMANTLHEGRHVSNDIIISLFAASRPRLLAAVYTCFDIVGALLMATIVIYVWPIVLEHYQGRYYAGTAGVIEIPTWPFMAVVVVGATATALQFLLDAGRMVWRAARGAT
jgi:TRAP-type C4-dicarboxylate transport system permease small subunit